LIVKISYMFCPLVGLLLLAQRMAPQARGFALLNFLTTSGIKIFLFFSADFRGTSPGREV
jgi:hypothetical protein